MEFNGAPQDISQNILCFQHNQEIYTDLEQVFVWTISL